MSLQSSLNLQERCIGVALVALGVGCILAGFLAIPVGLLGLLISLSLFIFSGWDQYVILGIVMSPLVLLPVGILSIDFGRRRLQRTPVYGACPRCRYALVALPSTGCPECGWGRE